MWVYEWASARYEYSYYSVKVPKDPRQKHQNDPREKQNPEGQVSSANTIGRYDKLRSTSEKNLAMHKRYAT